MNQHILCWYIDCAAYRLQHVTSLPKGLFFGGGKWGSMGCGAILAEPLEWLVDRHVPQGGTQ